MPTQMSFLEQAERTLIDIGIKFGPRVFVAILIMAAGFYAARWAGAIFDRSLGKLHLEPPVRLLLVRVVRLMVLALFGIMALQNIGVDLLPLIAGLGVAGAGLALAMQGVLGNLAAGLTIIFTKPFRVGEYVAMVGVEGRVEAIDLFSTELSHPDNSKIVVPNRKIIGEILHNYGHIRQLDLSVTLVGGERLVAALAAVERVLKANPRVLTEPAAIIGVAALNDAAIVIAVKPWVEVPDYGPAGAEINLAIVEEFKAAGVEYPVKAREIRLSRALHAAAEPRLQSVET